jgi:adenylate kinase family enzyme
MIIAGSGSGKSTTAIKLGEITGLPVVHIDPMY